jgi:hypothetical protein
LDDNGTYQQWKEVEPMTIDQTPASFEEVTRDDLYQRNDATFYHLTRVKGAQVEGTISVGISSDEVSVPGRASWEPKETVPALWIDYTPNHADESYSPSGGRSREVITINGKSYGEGFAAGVSGRVEFLPTTGNREHMAKFYRFATVGGKEYYLRGTVSQYDNVKSDRARDVLNATAEAIAAEYVTDQRWHAFRISQAEYQVNREREAVEKAVTKLGAAEQVLAELKEKVAE